MLKLVVFFWSFVFHLHKSLNSYRFNLMFIYCFDWEWRCCFEKGFKLLMLDSKGLMHVCIHVDKH